MKDEEAAVNDPTRTGTTVKQAVSRADVAAFIDLPGRVAAQDPHWIEPLRMERRQLLSPRGNPFFRHADVRLWLALRDGRPVGRISAQLDRLAAPDAGRRVGSFGMISAEDPSVLPSLFEAAEDWLRGLGAGLVRGPFNLSANQSCGLLVDGFDTPPYLLMEHDPRWLGAAVEACGYARARDLVAYELDLAARLPDRPRRIAERTAQEVAVRSVNMRRFPAEIEVITDIFNDAWADNWGFTPLTEAEIDAMAREMRPLIDADLVKIAEIDGRPVAFIVLLPNLNEAIRDLNGRLLPFGWAKLLWRLKVSGLRTGRVPLMGVRREISGTVLGKAIPLMLIYALEARALASGLERIELSWLLENNLPVRRMIEQLGGRLTKTWRIYEKPL
ncbi:N-acetyltransferase [Albimonas pacifica]|uniref:N-acetyltransferase domain-containing protein n=1 Tax=Albimonas pacifica TaxID=1114924 RepID=A0A1I3BQM0_9RHOB|nr:N-acetyltransferase [Albimonas pacifica]SFH64376.1 hypothetical protein SAMN05216258_101257 [Albimonas pacifica]